MKNINEGEPNIEWIGDGVESKRVCMDLVPEGSVIISGGIGTNISFDVEMISKKGCILVVVDPSNMSQQFLQHFAHIPNFLYLKKALNYKAGTIELYEGDSGNGLMGSTEPSHHSVSKSIKEVNTSTCEAITLQSLFDTYSNISYLKLDIEGGEYGILDSLQSLDIPQVSIEFHHFCSDLWSKEDTQNCIKKMNGWGYTEYCYGNDGVEFLFIKENQ
jgi:FkbM family methyltransferase